jgi:hypothetical protein
MKSKKGPHMTIVIMYNKKAFREGFDALPPSMTVGELKSLVRDKLKLPEDAKFFTNNGKMLKAEMDDWSFKQAAIKNGCKIMVTSGATASSTGPAAKDPAVAVTSPSPTSSSTAAAPTQSVSAPPVSPFVLIEEQLQLAETKWTELLPKIESSIASKDSAQYGGLRKELLVFNCLIDLLTKLDSAKASHRDEYDADGKGRSLVNRCNSFLDKVEAKKAALR